MQRIDDPGTEAYICKYDVDSPQGEVPIEDLEIVEWEAWNEDATVSFVTKKGTLIEKAATFAGLA